MRKHYIFLLVFEYIAKMCYLYCYVTILKDIYWEIFVRRMKLILYLVAYFLKSLKVCA